ncbi:MAG TPA: hypothetical protein VHO01_09635 [Jatrophihabitans sp.]|nr:hypothetical protein [Jatrophihabitans sp.]
MTGGGVHEQLQVWRIPPYQPALLMLVLVAAAALNIYAHPSATVRILTLAAGLGCGVLSLVSLRLHLVTNADGISVQQLRKHEWIDWAELDTVEVVGNLRGAPSLRLNRLDGTYVEVPPSLLQPTRPTAKQAVVSRLYQLAAQLEAQARAARAGT